MGGDTIHNGSSADLNPISFTSDVCQDRCTRFKLAMVLRRPTIR